MKYWLLTFLFASTTHAVDFEKSLRETPAGRALAARTGHAYCEVKDQSGGVMTGFNTQKLVPLASVSKVFLSYWALDTLGPDFRFATKLHIRAINSSQVDVHLEGSRDPFMGREMIFFIVSELNRMGVQQIRNLTYDENFRLFLNVKEDIATERGLTGAISSQETGENLRLIMNDDSWSATSRDGYRLAIERAAQKKITLLPGIHIRTRNVNLVKASAFKPIEKSSTILLQSAPLWQYLKQMNIYSMNYIADVLWENLGQAAAFQSFYQQKLQLGSEQLRFFSGSGLPRVNDGKRYDNLASCETVLKVLKAFQSRLIDAGLDLTDVMLVAGIDGGTLAATYQDEARRDAIVAKTGSIATARTFAGAVSTKEGLYFFASIFRLEDESEVEQATMQRDYLIRQLLAEHGGKQAFGYQEVSFLPFDAGSYFKDVTQASAGTAPLH